eukprot:m.181420 g.181420  ORF g.181420 m.181420 type:complete len:134 (-) comp16628_c4_seq5:500-901(-)
MPEAGTFGDYDPSLPQSREVQLLIQSDQEYRRIEERRWREQQQSTAFHKQWQGQWSGMSDRQKIIVIIIELVSLAALVLLGYLAFTRSGVFNVLASIAAVLLVGCVCYTCCCRGRSCANGGDDDDDEDEPMLS